jgi:hypothetical protein
MARLQKVDDMTPRSGKITRFARTSLTAALALGVTAALGGSAFAAPDAPPPPRSASSGGGTSSGGDQYRPGYAWGDPDHNHKGPPGVRRAGGVRKAPLKARPTADRKAAVVATQLVIDEQAVLHVAVLGPGGKRLLLTQGGSRVGGKVTGPQTKTILYKMTIPRAFRLQLRIPLNLLQRGKTYLIEVVAVDPSGKRSRLVIPFRA